MNTQKKANTVQIIAYGTLMTGERNHCFCRNAVSIRPCVVTGTLYDTGYGFPAYMPAGSTQVKAELMEIPMEDWAAVDRLEGYPRLYDRQLCRVKMLDDGSETVAWIYIMNNLPRQAKIIVSGDWKAHERKQSWRLL